jgi:hypothetical protein
MQYPHVLDPTRVGTYPALAKSGGGFVWTPYWNIGCGVIRKTDRRIEKREATMATPVDPIAR